MAGILTDLHAADVQCHVDCKTLFMCPRSVQAASHQSTRSDQALDASLNSIIAYLICNKTTIHNSVDLYNKYVQEGGHLLSK